jgi:hypothetical protein
MEPLIISSDESSDSGCDNAHIADDPFDDGMDTMYVEELDRIEEEMRRGDSEFIFLYLSIS